MIRYYYRTIKDPRPKILDDFKVGAWIYVYKPHEEEIKQLSQNFQLNSSLLKDGLDPYEVPRLEIEENALYIFARMPCPEEENQYTIPILIILANEFILTLSKIHLPFLEKFEENQIQFSTTQKIKFFIQLLHQIIELYNQELLRINRHVRHLSIAPEKIRTKDILQFISFENKLNEFLGDLIPTNNLLKRILGGNLLRLYQQDYDLIEDLLLNTGQLIELCKSTLKSIMNIREGYSTIMSHNLNNIMKFLTSLTVVLTIPTIIASFYGMNVRLPFSKSPIAFWGITLITVIISLTTLTWFAKKNWL